MHTRDHIDELEIARRFFAEQSNMAYLWSDDSPELLFLYRVLRILSADPAMARYHFYVTNQKPLPRLGRDVVVIQIGNEDHAIPVFANDVLLTFTPFPPPQGAPHNLHAIPLGFNGQVPELPMKPFAERTIDAFFSGQRWNDRWKIGRGVERLASMPAHAGRRFHVEYTSGFRSGMEPAEYARHLMDSRIAFAPRGTHSPVTFRMFEAARSGNAIISCVLPDTWYYRAFPGIQLDDWDTLPTVLARLLACPASLATLHERTRWYYEEYCSERAVARYMHHAIVAAGSTPYRNAAPHMLPLAMKGSA